MKTSRQAPIWIRIPSYFFAMMVVVSIITILSVIVHPAAGANITISFGSNSVKYAEHPIAFLGIAALFVFAALLAFLILFRHIRAYDVGIVYCATAFLFLGTLTAMGIGVMNDPISTYLGLLIVFGGLGWFFFSQA